MTVTILNHCPSSDVFSLLVCCVGQDGRTHVGRLDVLYPASEKTNFGSCVLSYFVDQPYSVLGLTSCVIHQKCIIRLVMLTPVSCVCFRSCANPTKQTRSLCHSRSRALVICLSANIECDRAILSTLSAFGILIDLHNVFLFICAYNMYKRKVQCLCFI